MTRPSLASTIAALRTTDPRFDWVKPTEDEADAADALQILEDHHQGSADDPDESEHWGHCLGCDELWPCAAWVYGEHLAVQWLGRAADRVWAHAKAVIDSLSARDRRAA